MCTKAGTEQKRLFPTRGAIFCYKAQSYDNYASMCTFIHERVSEEEATNMIKLFKKFIENPNVMKVN